MVFATFQYPMWCSRTAAIQPHPTQSVLGPHPVKECFCTALQAVPECCSTGGNS